GFYADLVVEEGHLVILGQQVATVGPENDGPVVQDVMSVGPGQRDCTTFTESLDDFLRNSIELVMGLRRLHTSLRKHILIVEERTGFSKPGDTIAFALVGGRLIVGLHEGIFTTEFVDVKLLESAGRRKLRVPSGSNLED